MSKNIIIGFRKFAYDFIFKLYDNHIPVENIDKATVFETCYITTATIKNNKISKPKISNRESDFCNIKQRVRNYNTVILMSDDTCDLADAIRGLIFNHGDDDSPLIKKCIAITTQRQRIKHSGWFYHVIKNNNVLQVNGDNYTCDEVLNFIKEKTGNENAK